MDRFEAIEEERPRARERTQADFWWDQVQLGERYDRARGGARRWICPHCGDGKTGGVDRVKAHLLGLTGYGINICPRIRAVDRETLQREYTRFPEARTPNARRQAPPPRYTHEAGPSSSFMHREPTTASVTQPQGSQSSNVTPPEGSRQHTLFTSWHPQRKAHVDGAIARFFYANGISFHKARSPFFREMCSEIAQFGPTYQPPSYDALREKLLDNEVSSIKEAIEPVKQLWPTYGVTLVADSWSDVRGKSLEGIVVSCNGKPIFIKAIDFPAQQRTTDVIANSWIEAVEYVGEEMVVQFVIDGEATNRAAGTLLQQRFPHITWSACMAHCLNNLLKDMSNIPWVKSVIMTGREIITFITRHTFSLSLYHKFARKELLKYAETRFAYNFLMLRHLHTVRPALLQMVASPEWASWPSSRTAMGQLCYTTITQEEYWPEMRHVLQIFIPVVVVLQRADSDVPYIGKIYEAMDRMIENMRCIEKDSQRLTDIEEFAISRWNQYSSPLHCAAYLLDPEFQHKVLDLMHDSEVARNWNLILQRLVPTQEARRVIKDQLAFYRMKTGMFGWPDAQVERFKVGAVTWWEDYGADCPELKRLAVRILSQAISSSAVERLWSNFGNVMTKKRNRLGLQKANDLVFVSTNLRLLTNIRSQYNVDKYIGFHKSEQDAGAIAVSPEEEEEGERDVQEELEEEEDEDDEES